MAPSQGDILHEHTLQIAALKVDFEAFRGKLASLNDEQDNFQDAVRKLSLQIGEAPRPDEGVEGHGLARAIAVLNERIEPLVEDHAKAEKARSDAPAIRRARISTVVAILSLIIAALTFATKQTPTSSAAPPPAIVDASTN